MLADDDERVDAGITLETTEETVERSTKFTSAEGKAYVVNWFGNLLFSVSSSNVGLIPISDSKSA